MQASSTTADEIETTDDNVVLNVADRRFKRIKIVVRNGYKDALVLPSGCRNVIIDWLEIDTWSADGIKVQNAGTPARNVTINGGYARGWAIYDPSVHQDGIQTMGGADITLKNLAMDFVGGGGGCIFVAMGGSGAMQPANYTFDHCAIGPSHPNCVRMPTPANSVIRNSLIYSPYSGRQAISLASTNRQENCTIRPAPNRAQHEAIWEEMKKWVGGTAPAPDPGPGPAPTPGDCDDLQAALDTANAQKLAAQREAAQLTAALKAANLKEAEIDALLAEAAAVDIVPG